MENEKVKHSGVHDSVSKCEDLGDGSIADVERKTDNVAVNLTDKNNLPAGAVNEELDVNLHEQSDSVSRPELKTPDPGDDESVDIIKTLEADLLKARNFLINMQEHTKKTKSELSAQISDLQTQRDSLLYELEQTTKEVNDSKSIEAALRARVAALESKLKMSKVNSEITGKPVVHAKPQVVSEAEADEKNQEFHLDKEKQVEITGTIEHNQEISKKISYPESDVEVVTKVDEQQTLPSVDEPEVSVPENVEIAETEQVELAQQHEVEPAIETVTIHSDEQQQAETELEEFTPKTPEAESSVMLDVLEEEAKTVDFPSITDKIIFIRALADIRNQDQATRLNAVKTIGGIRHEFSVRALIAQMTVEDSAQIRTECIKALAALNMKEAIPAIELALTDKVVAIRLAAVRALYRLAGSDGARTLVRMLSDEDADVRRRTATCISWLGQEDLATELVPLLDDRNISVRRAAVEAMVNLRSRKAVPGLIRHLNDPEKKMRRAINAALESITGKKMGRTFPTDEKSFRCLIARWQQWWNDEYTVIF